MPLLPWWTNHFHRLHKYGQQFWAWLMPISKNVVVFNSFGSHFLANFLICRGPFLSVSWRFCGRTSNSWWGSARIWTSQRFKIPPLICLARCGTCYQYRLPFAKIGWDVSCGLSKLSWGRRWTNFLEGWFLHQPSWWLKGTRKEMTFWQLMQQSDLARVGLSSIFIALAGSNWYWLADLHYESNTNGMIRTF